MSISDKIQRLQTAKESIATAITEMGGTVEQGDGFESFAADISGIPIGDDLDTFIAGEVTEVTSNLEVIPDFAFSAKSGLETVNLPEANYIGKYAFSSAAGGSSASGSSSGGGSGSGMDFNNNSLTTVAMPKVTNIESSAFAGDSNLEITSLSDTLLVIQDKAFKGCPKVQLTEFPENIIYIGDEALDTQENLSIDTMPATLLYLGAGITKAQISTYLSQYVDSETGILDLSQVPAQWLQMGIAYNISSDSRFSGITVGTTIEIPSGISVLADRLFYNVVSNVDTIILPEGLLSIGNSAFYNCGALTSLSLPSSLVDIGKEAFLECRSLTSLDLSNTQLTIINGGTFEGCRSLASLMLPNSCTRIDTAAFHSSGFVSLDLSSTHLTSIGQQAFGSSRSLLNIILPNTLTLIEDFAFGSCNSLTTIDLTAFDGSSVPTIRFRAFGDSYPEGFKFLFSTQAALDAFAADSSWSEYTSYFQVVSE